MHVLSTITRAAFGIATRRVFIDALLGTLLILMILLMVAWTIDLSARLPQLRSVAASRGVGLMSLTVPHMIQRTADIATNFLPMACFFGAFVAELRRRAMLETVILSAAGASPARLVIGLLWLGMLFGSVQWALDARWRPAAIAAEIDTGIGRYARRYAQVWLGEPQWILGRDVAIRGEVFRGDPPSMRDVLIFDDIRADELGGVTSAERMLPGAEPMSWRLEGVARWSPDAFVGDPVEDRTVTLDLIPEMLRYRGVEAAFLPTSALRAYDVLPDWVDRPRIETALWRRYTAFALPVVMLILGTALARAGFDGRRAHVPRLIGLAAGGYIVVVSVKVFWQVGAQGVMPGWLAASAGMGVALCVAALAPRLFR